LVPAGLHAEGYIAGQIGALLRSNLTNVEESGGGLVVSPHHLGDVKLATSPLLGVKAGYFIPGSLQWLGGEAEYYKTSPDRIAQTVPDKTSGGGRVFDAMHIEMNTLAFNLIARYPGERLQPYLGAGLGLFWAKAAPGGLAPPGEVSSFSTGLNILGGLRFFVTKSLAVFGEYKYNRATLDFPQGTGSSGFKGDYHPQHVVLGIGYHF
jgi:opacity protein-like surface antigen